MIISNTSSTFFAELAHHCAEHRTGTLVAATTDNHAVCIVLNDGFIVALTYRQKRGEVALRLLEAATIRRYSFAEVALTREADPDLPDTAQILHALRLAEEIGEDLTPVSQKSFKSQLREIVEAELTELLGPIGPIVCAEHIARGFVDVDKFLTVLAQEIDDPSQAWEFKSRVLSRLHNERSISLN